MKVSATKANKEVSHELSEKDLIRLIVNGRLNGSEMISPDGKKWISLRNHPRYNRLFSSSSPPEGHVTASCPQCGETQIKRSRCRKCGAPFKRPPPRPSPEPKSRNVSGQLLLHLSTCNPYIGETLKGEEVMNVKNRVLLKEETLLGLFLVEVPLKLKEPDETLSSSREIMGVTNQRVFIYLPDRSGSDNNVISFSLNRISNLCSYKSFFSWGWGFRIHSHWIFFDNFKEPEAEKAIDLIRFSSGMTMEDRMHLGHEIDAEILLREIGPFLAKDEKLLGAFLGHASWSHCAPHPNQNIRAFQRDCLIITQKRVIFYQGTRRGKPEYDFKSLPYETILNLEGRDNVLYGDIIFNLKGEREKFEYIMESDFARAFQLIQRYLTKTRG